MRCEIKEVSIDGNITTVKGWYVPAGYTCLCKKQDFEIEVEGRVENLKDAVIDILTFIR